METARQAPDRPLREGRGVRADENRGRLKIFFGYADGVGKTYAMLQAAHLARGRGINVAVGYIGQREQPQTQARLYGLEQIGPKRILDGKEFAYELDIDDLLAKRPGLVLIDELAHTNAAGCRHAKRYQDVQELLTAGIDVYTTVNVRNIESLNDTVAAITGVREEERIPDFVFDGADQVELVDIEPEELLERLEGEALRRGEGEKEKLPDAETLTALRELALRRCADRVKLLAERARVRSRGEYHADEHILVCLSSSPSNEKIIRTAARMAMAFKGSFTALFVETPDTAAMSLENRKRLQKNARLAQQLGAAVETCYGEEVPEQIAEFARLSGVSKIVIGRSVAARRRFFDKPPLTERLIKTAPNMDIYVIPDAGADERYRPDRRLSAGTVTKKDIIKCVAVLAAVTLVGFAFQAFGFTEANIVAIYIFGVLISSIITDNRLCGPVSSLVSVMVFNFFFTVPRYTLHFYDPDYLVTFVVMFMVAFLTSSLAAKLKDNAKQSAHAAFRTKILFETNQLLQKERDEQSVLRAAAGQLQKLLKRDLLIYPLDGKKLGEPYIYRMPESVQKKSVSENEKAVAEWVFQNNKRAGAGTDTLSNAECQYLAIRAGRQVFGVIGIRMDGTSLEPFENSVLLSVLGECALALENIRNAKEKEEAHILAKNEQLRANLLRAISHDLRTPLTSISGSAGNLMTNYQKMDDARRLQTFTDIYEDSMWLIGLVENLLAMTRIEDGRVRMTQNVELMDEVIAEALRHVSRKVKEHSIRVSSSEEMILAFIDAKLVVQVIVNLVDNAVKYTPPGSVIEIHTEKKDGLVVVSVADDGPGISDEQKKHVFDMFYSGANKVADSRRSLGLGLSLCKSIVTAHGGTICVSDHQPKGAVFTFTLPAGEVELHE